MVEGGEVEFVKKMVDESLKFKNKIRVYTSMVGKKSSLTRLKQYIKSKDITNFSTTEFCQGRTMRWAIAWTFDSSVTFPKSLFQQERAKVKTALVHSVPVDIKCCNYDIPDLTNYFKENLFQQLQMKSATLHQDLSEFVCIVTARTNTWSHSRRKRRMERFKQSQLSKPHPVDKKVSRVDNPCKKLKLDSVEKKEVVDSPCEELKLDTARRDDVTAVGEVSYTSSCEESSAEEKPLISFSLELKLEGVYIKLYMKLIDCEQKDMLNQILQYFKNRLV
ncbi:METTL16 [Bugula neritina]|uniref:METTL16 n=1 Tax=Bugula neritina TaxID=10212 RepID=A0A7J7KGR7_BUGNE|nr:METTL16 [Bugula neritina]